MERKERRKRKRILGNEDYSPQNIREIKSKARWSDSCSFSFFDLDHLNLIKTWEERASLPSPQNPSFWRFPTKKWSVSSPWIYSSLPPELYTKYGCASETQTGKKVFLSFLASVSYGGKKRATYPLPPPSRVFHKMYPPSFLQWRLYLQQDWYVNMQINMGEGEGRAFEPGGFFFPLDASHIPNFFFGGRKGRGRIRSNKAFTKDYARLSDLPWAIDKHGMVYLSKTENLAYVFFPLKYLSRLIFSEKYFSHFPVCSKLISIK